MKPLAVFLKEAKAVLKSGKPNARNLALDKATDALQVYPNSKKLNDFITTLVP